MSHAIERMLAAGIDFRRFGSGALGLASVADGRADAYLELHINSWDCLAGILLVEEAGGRVNDFLADDGLRRGNPILAAAPGVADAISELAGVPLLPDAAHAPGISVTPRSAKRMPTSVPGASSRVASRVDREQLADRRCRARIRCGCRGSWP